MSLSVARSRFIPPAAFLLMVSGMLAGCSLFAEKHDDPEPVSAERQTEVNNIYTGFRKILEAANVPDSVDEALVMSEEGSPTVVKWAEWVAQANQLAVTCLKEPACDTGKVAGYLSELMQRQNQMLQMNQELVAGLQRQDVEVSEPEELQVTPDEGEDLTSERDAPGSDAAVLASEMSAPVTEHTLKGRNFTTMIPMNDPVKAALDDWLTWGRPRLLLAYENYQYLRPLIAPVYEKAGLPEPLLFAMIATESTGKAHARSRAGAAGILQFMRFTGKKYGLHVVKGFDQRYDPVRATEANARYITDHLKRFNNSLEKTLAAYNGGENRMLRLQRKYRSASIWDKRIYYALPRETREYVPKVLAAAWLFMHPEQYRLSFPQVDNQLVDLVLARETSMSELGLCLGQAGSSRYGWFRTLRNLNPAIKPQDIIEKGTSLKVPAVIKDLYQANCNETDERFLQMAREMHRANYPDGSEMIRYVVRKGDTANRIAARFECVSTRELVAINKIRPPRYLLRVGQVLQVPDC